jgi:large subunit ribosomal protein L6
MSRIGKQPIDLPSGVTINASDDIIKVKGPKGELEYVLPSGISISVAEGKLQVNRATDRPGDRALHGLARSLMANMVTGVSAGYKRVLEITGVGYRASAKGSAVVFTLGYSHPVEFRLPAGVSAASDEKQITVTLTGIDKQLLGQVAANMRKLRPPDAYKGKGVRYAGERIKLKAGKAGKK